MDKATSMAPSEESPQQKLELLSQIVKNNKAEV